MTGRRWLRESAAPLVETYDTALLDLDGVVYVGADAVPGAADAIESARDAAVRVAFVTNNASRTPHAVAAQLTDLGIPATTDDVVTSAQAAAGLLADRFPAGSAVLVVGGEGVRAALEERGLKPVSSADDQPVALVQGFASDLSYADFAEGMVAIRQGALFVASNLDRTLPSPRGPLPGNGSLVEMLRYATGVTPLSAGKPEPPLYQEAMRRTGARRPLVVGDRLDTDIEGAVRTGVDSLLVLTGLTDAELLVGAGEDLRPTYLASDLGALLLPQPAAVPDGERWTCGGWTASVHDGAVRLDGDGDGDHDDALRVTCAAAWSAADTAHTVDATAALDVLAGLRRTGR